MSGVLAGACCHHSQRNDCFCPSYHFPPDAVRLVVRGAPPGRRGYASRSSPSASKAPTGVLSIPAPSAMRTRVVVQPSRFWSVFRRHQQNLDRVRMCSVLDVTLNISTKESQAVARQTEIWMHEPIRAREQLTLGTTRSTTTPDLTTLLLPTPENS